MTPYTSYSPQQQQDDDNIQFSDDKNFALDGKIMLLVLIVVFALLMVLIFMVPYLKMHARRRNMSWSWFNSRKHFSLYSPLILRNYYTSFVYMSSHGVEEISVFDLNFVCFVDSLRWVCVCGYANFLVICFNYRR